MYVSLNLTHGEVYLIQHYVIKFISYLRQVSGFIEVLGFSPTDRHNITEILLKMALNTITLTPVYFIVKFLPNNYCKTSLLVYWPTCSPQVWYIMGLMPWLLKCGISWV